MDEGTAAVAYKIKVTEIIDPTKFWAQIGSNDHMKQIKEFEDTINEYGNSSPDPPVVLDTLKHSQTVLVKHEGNWRRAQIVSIDELDEGVDVQLIDYKSTCRVPASQIKVDVPGIATEYDPCVHPCRLAGIQPIISGKWISRSVHEFSKLVQDEELDCNILNDQMDPIPVDIFIWQNEGVKTVSQLLIDSGAARDYDDPATVPTVPADLNIPMFNMDIINKSPEVAVSPPESEKEDDIEQQVAIEQMGGIVSTGYLSQYKRADSKLTKGISQQLSYDGTIGIHNQVMQLQTSEESSTGFSDSQESSPPRFRGRGRMKKLQTHIPEVGASRLIVKPSNSDTQTHSPSKSPVTSLKEAAMPLARYGLGNGEMTPKKLEDPVYGQIGSGDADSDTPTFSDNDLHRESPQKERRSVSKEKTKQQLYSAYDRHRDKQRRGSGPVAKGRSKQFEDYESSDHSPSSPEKTPRSKGSRRHQALDMTVKQQNDYEWRAGRLRQDIDAILEEAYSDTKQERLEKLIFPKESALEGLPGPKEFVVFLDVLITKSVESYDSFHSDTLFYIEQYQDEETFVCAFGDMVMKKEDKYVVAGTCTTQYPQHFAKTIAQIWLHLGQWNYRSAEVMTACIRKLMDKWAMPQVHQVCEDMQQVYARCLLHLFRVAGPQLLSVFKSDFTAIIGSLEHRLLASDTSREVKEYYLSIVMLYQEWQVKMLPSAPQTRSCGVQTSPAPVKNKLVQTETCEAPALTTEVPGDPYGRIKKMLKDLHLEELWSVFEENAVRDSTIYQSDFTDVKDLLKEIGLKAGHILEIKSYLSNCPRTSSPGSSVETLTSFVSPVVVSPQSYEETSKRLNNQLMQDQSSISCTPVYSNSTIMSIGSAHDASSSHLSSQKTLEAAKPREKYQPPFRRDGSDKTKSENPCVIDDLAAAPQQFYSASKAFIPPPPGFTPLPSSWAADNKAFTPPEESRADNDANWRKKPPQNGGSTAASRDITSNGKMTRLGKQPQNHTKTEPTQMGKTYKKILSETQSFLDHSLKKDTFKLSNPDLHATIPSHLSEQGFPSYSEVAGGKHRPTRPKSAASVTNNKPVVNNTSSVPSFTPVAAAVKQESTTKPHIGKSFPVFCAVCNSQEHETHKCTQKSERYANC